MIGATGARAPAAKESSGAQVGGLELVAQTPDAVDVRPATGVDPMSQDAAQPLVVGGERQLRIAEAVEVRPQQGSAELGVVDRIIEIDASMEQRRAGPCRGIGLDLH